MRIFIVSLISYLILFSQAYADLNIEITGGREEGGQPIAIVPFGKQVGTTPSEDVAQIVTQDLQRSGRFTPTPVGMMPGLPFEISQVNFPAWQAIAVPHLVFGRINGNSATGYHVEFQLVDVAKTEQLLGLSYPASNNTLRQVAHQISDAIYQKLTGERGAFSTRLVYVTHKQSGGQHTYSLYASDADGASPHLMLRSSEPIMSPKWSPDGRRIAYVSFEGKRTGIYLQDVRTGKRDKVAAWSGLNSAPAWSPDGTRLAMSLSKDGNSEIYILHLQTGTLTRLTNNPAIDTEPIWSPDGKTIAFTSDRTGTPQIYRMSASGGEVQRVTFEGNYNASPRFSPDGKKMAFLRGGNGYRVATMDLENGQTNVISQSTSDEAPSFAPNGSMLIYGSGSSLSAISVDGRVQQRLSTEPGEEIREPAWSPFNN